MNTNENSFERGFERGFKAGVESTKATPPLPAHPLLSREEVLTLIAQGMPLNKIMHRRTGKSTAHALSGLAWVIGHPGQVLKVYDHYGTRMANDNLLNMMRDMASKLGLRNLVFNRADQTVMFKNPEA